MLLFLITLNQTRMYLAVFECANKQTRARFKTRLEAQLWLRDKLVDLLCVDGETVWRALCAAGGVEMLRRSCFPESQNVGRFDAYVVAI